MKKITFGRSKDCDIIFNDQTVTRNHGYLLIDNNKVYLIDDNSRNGTFVNGKQIKGKVQLSTGDEVLLAKKFRLNWKQYVNIDNDETILCGDGTIRGSYSDSDNASVRNNNSIRPIVDIPSRMEINKNYAEVYRNADSGADWKVPLKRNMGDKIGNAVGETLGCIFSIIIFALFLGLVFLLLAN